MRPIAAPGRRRDPGFGSIRGSPEFLVELVPDRERVVVCRAGEVDIATAGHLEQAIIEMMERGFERWSWISRR